VKVAGGSLDTEAPVLTGDEIGKLAVSFNRMTARLRDVYQELAHREERFRSLIESSSDIIVVLDAAGKPTFASPSVQRLLGYSPADLLGRDCSDLVHEEDRARIREYFDRPAREGIDPAGALFRVRHRDGSWRFLEATGRNLLDQPNVAGIVVDARDITERRHLEDQLAQAQKMEAIGRLASGIAHDFNNLLTAIIGYTEMLGSELAGDPGKSAMLGEIRKAADRAAALTRQLLAFSRRQILQPRPVNLNRLVLSMGNMLERLIGENIRLEVLPAKDLWTVLADPSQMEQVLLNITLNARDAMPEGGKVLIQTANLPPGTAPQDLPAGAYVQLCVTDTGQGMDQETLSRVFEPFFTTKKRGTGLGLATVYGIVRQSGGQIEVRSSPGQGSSFRIYLPAGAQGGRGEPPATAAPAGPAAVAVTAAARPGSTAAPAASARPTGAGQRVFVAEDEPAVNRMIVENLQRLGYQVASAVSPAEALASNWGPIDLLVTDMVMPGLSGGELAERLRASNPRLRVLFISGYMEAEEARRSIQVKGTAFLQKPFASPELARAVSNALADPD
jgi:two-component system cell cycle sensor histidine kinase/response regulator CckA